MADEEIKEELSSKHKAFVDAYFFTFRLNPTEAYSHVYPKASKKSASQKGAELLKKVEKSSYFVAKRSEYNENLGITLQKQLETLYSIIELDVSTICTDKGISIEEIKNLPVEARRLIEEIRPTQNGLAIRFVSKQFALQELNRMLGYLKPKKLEIDKPKDIEEQTTKKVVEVVLD